MGAAAWRPEGSPTQVVYAGRGDAPLVSERGHPIPPQEVVQELNARYPGIRVEWLQGAWGMSGWALKKAWGSEDKRWERVRSGECDPDHAFDLLTRFPPETRSGDMLGWIDRNIAGSRRIDPAKEAERLVAQAAKLMAEAQALGVDQVVDQGTQRILDESDHLRHVRAGAERAHPMISGADFTEREPKRLL